MKKPRQVRKQPSENIIVLQASLLKRLKLVQCGPDDFDLMRDRKTGDFWFVNQVPAKSGAKEGLLVSRELAKAWLKETFIPKEFQADFAQAPEPEIVQPDNVLPETFQRDGFMGLELTPARAERLKWFTKKHFYPYKKAEDLEAGVASWLLDIALAYNLQTSKTLKHIIAYAKAEGIENNRSVLQARLAQPPQERTVSTKPWEDDGDDED